MIPEMPRKKVKKNSKKSKASGLEALEAKVAEGGSKKTKKRSTVAKVGEILQFFWWNLRTCFKGDGSFKLNMTLEIIYKRKTIYSTYCDCRKGQYISIYVYNCMFKILAIWLLVMTRL